MPKTDRLRFPEYEETFGPVLNKARKQQGLSTGALGLALGYTNLESGRTKVWETETKQVDVRISHVFKLCEILGPNFVDALADEMFAIAMNGLAHKRDALLVEAGKVATEAATRKRKPRPPKAQPA